MFFVYLKVERILNPPPDPTVGHGDSDTISFFAVDFVSPNESVGSRRMGRASSSSQICRIVAEEGLQLCSAWEPACRKHPIA